MLDAHGLTPEAWLEELLSKRCAGNEIPDVFRESLDEPPPFCFQGKLGQISAGRLFALQSAVKE